jgi:hypothetical protein
MSDDNIIDIPVKKDIKYDKLEERIEACFRATIRFDLDHQRSCIYCLHNEATGDMLFDILAKDMTLASKQKNLLLTTFDCRQALAIALMRINETEYEMAEKASEETGARGQGESRGSEVGNQTTTETSTAVEEGIREVIPFSRKTGQDRKEED